MNTAMRRFSVSVCRQCLRCDGPAPATRLSSAFRRPIIHHTKASRPRSFRTLVEPVPSYRRQLHVSSRSCAIAAGDNKELQLVAGEASFGAAQKDTEGILSSSGIPSEAAVLHTLEQIERAAQHVVESNSLVHLDPTPKLENPASALLSLQSRPATPKTSGSAQESANVTKTITQLSEMAYNLVFHPPVFLSADVLSRYVNIQTLLLRPSSLPEIFDLYATKPSPAPSKTAQYGVSYTKTNPDAISVAIDTNVANRALDAAIHTRDLPLALGIIETTFATRSHQRSKFFRVGLPPLLGAAATPLAAWTLASQLSTVQTGLSPEVFTQVAFAGFFTYAACVGTIGYVALTTANDQMQRVTWAIGMPLRARWIREDERAALDRVSMAWGFKDKYKWGEEEGQEWEELKEWVGMRGMILDKVSLMEGME